MVLHYLHTIRLFGRDTRLTFATAALLSFSVFGVYSVLFNLYVLRLGLGTEFVGLVNASGLLSGALFSLPSGELGRRWGSRNAMVAGLILAVVGYGLVPVAELLPEATRPAWVVSTYFAGCLGALAAFMVNLTPYLMGVTAPHLHNHAFSLLSAIPMAAAFLGALAGGLLPRPLAAIIGSDPASSGPYGLSLVLAALLLIPAVVAAAGAHDPVRDSRVESHRPGGGGQTAPVALMATLAAILFVRACGQGATRVFFNVYLDDGLGTPTALIGTLSAVSQLTAIPAALMVPFFAGRWGNARTYVVAVLGMAASLLPLALWPRWEAAALGYLGSTVFFAMASPSITVFSQSLVSPRWRPTMEGMVMMAVNLGHAGMAFGGGYMVARSGYSTLWLVGAAFMVAGAFLFWAYFRRPRGELARLTEPGR